MDLVERLAGRLAPRTADHLRWIKASVGQNVRLIPVEEVLFFQSDEKYTRVVTAEAETLIRKPIKELLDELDPDKFWQVHRATIVNVDAIAVRPPRPQGPGRDRPQGPPRDAHRLAQFHPPFQADVKVGRFYRTGLFPESVRGAIQVRNRPVL